MMTTLKQGQTFILKQTVSKRVSSFVALISTIELTQSRDEHLIEGDWCAWLSSTPRNPEMAFLGFCKNGCGSGG